MENILQNLDDIDNMVSVEKLRIWGPYVQEDRWETPGYVSCPTVYACREAKKNFCDSLITERSKPIQQDILLLWKNIWIPSPDDVFPKIILFGQSLPIRISENKWMIYVLDEVDVLESYKRDKNKQKLKVILSLIIFNLIADGRLNADIWDGSSDDHPALYHYRLRKNSSPDYIDIIEKELGVYAPQIKETQRGNAVCRQRHRYQR